MVRSERSRAVRRRLRGIEALAPFERPRRFGERAIEDGAARSLGLTGWRAIVIATAAVIVIMGSALSIVNFFRTSAAPTEPGAIAAAPGGGATPGAEEAPAGAATPEPTPTDPPVLPERRHQVAPGDTLHRIATEYDVTIAAIAERNGIENIDRISVGTMLIIPDSKDPPE